MVSPYCRMNASIWASVVASVERASSRPPSFASAGWLIRLRIWRKPRTRRCMSSGWSKKFGSISGAANGSALASVTLPRLSGRSTHTWAE